MAVSNLQSGSTRNAIGMPPEVPVRLRFGAENMETVVIVPTIDRSVVTTDPPEQAGQRVGERRLHDLFTDAPDVAGAMPPRRERRAAHVFQAVARALDAGAGEQAPCRVCGYAETGHHVLSAPEAEIVTALVNQRQPPAFMRRSILRKLASSLRIR